MALPQGNYEVTVLLGDPAGVSDTTVKAESRRLMLNHVVTAPKEQVTRKFTVNIRQPEYIRAGGIERSGEALSALGQQADDRVQRSKPLRRGGGDRSGRNCHDGVFARRFDGDGSTLRAMELVGSNVAGFLQ